MKNESKIKGNGNVNIQGVSESKISVDNKTTTESKVNKIWIILPILIALIGLIIQVLIGWKELINWFYAK
jgi:hypothetical protein